jgi:hypothetical protein
MLSVSFWSGATHRRIGFVQVQHGGEERQLLPGEEPRNRSALFLRCWRIGARGTAGARCDAGIFDGLNLAKPKNLAR